MVLLSLKVGKAVLIGDHIRVVIADVDANTHVTLAVHAPHQISIHREEDYSQRQDQDPTDSSHTASHDQLFSLRRASPPDNAFHESYSASIADEQILDAVGQRIEHAIVGPSQQNECVEDRVVVSRKPAISKKDKNRFAARRLIRRSTLG